MIDEEDVTGELRKECIAWVEQAWYEAGPVWHDMYIWIVMNGYGIIADVDPADLQEFLWESSICSAYLDADKGY